MSESLWPDLPREKIRTPHSVLLEQANFLGEKTKGLLLGRVTRGQRGGELNSCLLIVAPLLNNYSYEVCTICYPASLYPCVLDSSVTDKRYSVADEDHLTTALKEILGAPELVRVMTGLLAQVQSDEEAKSKRPWDKPKV